MDDPRGRVRPAQPVEPPPAPEVGRARPLDLSQDPDRYRPDEEPLVPGFGPLDPSQDPDRFRPDEAPELPRGLDPAYDPDRFRPPGQGQSLTDLLGKEGAQEEDRDGWQWLYGLVTVLAFLALVSWLFGTVLTP